MRGQNIQLKKKNNWNFWEGETDDTKTLQSKNMYIWKNNLTWFLHYLFNRAEIKYFNVCPAKKMFLNYLIIENPMKRKEISDWFPSPLLVWESGGNY